MTRIVIVGEIYNADLSIGGGPIIPSSPPLGIWGGGNQPFPTPPIAGPGRPPWWGMAQDPGYGIPVGGVPHPSHPIHLGPGGEIGGPPGTWGGAGERFPTNPIAGPGRPPWWGMAQDPGYGIIVGPDVPPPDPIPPVTWKTAWTAATGWIVIGIPTGPTPTPSA